MMPRLILIRGLPGSGKSTLAKCLFDFYHVEADMYFLSQGVYKYNAAKIKDAHAWCQDRVFDALQFGKNVVVSNTFTRHFEMEPYLDMARNLKITASIVTANGAFENVHNVPDDIIQKMRERWEP